MTEEELKLSVEAHLKSALAMAQAEATALRSRPVHTNWLIILVGVVVIAVLLFIVIDRHYSYEQSVVEAKAQEKIADASEKTRKAEEAARLESQKALLQQIASTQRTIADLQRKSLERDVTTKAKIDEVTTPNRSIEQVAKDSTDYLQATPLVSSTGLTYTPAQVQVFIATRLDRDNLQLKVKDFTSELSAQAGVIAKCTASMEEANKMVAGYQSLIVEKDATIASYKKAAIKSRWQRVWEVAQKVGFVAIGIGIGAAIH